MPTYDYRCSACDALFEVNRSMGSKDPEPCPACGSQTKRVFSPVGVAFKGSGFHNTDYRPRPAESGSTEAPACPAKSSSGSGCSGCPAAE